jgi:uncharacterized membrane protein (DUF2068 family)
MSNSHNVGDPAKRRDHHRGLRTVAILEASKGILVLLAAFGFAEVLLRHIDLEDAAQNLLELLHIAPEHRISQAFVDFAGRMMDANLVVVLAIAFVYSSLRFIESYGLWRQRVWAEWLAIISGAIYLPFELYNLIRRPTAAHWIILLINIGVVFYIAWVRWDEIKGRQRSSVRRFAEDGD